ncbi:opioid growth factor receptor-related protein [Methylobacterium platani]|uniref:Opioid growth factor receptor (OGFr) conserved region n=2 Tax=Methylobacterium platani TaxID=427683 RepID=A0A179SEA0_9HYPH|nr:opioid growth factor receptor-related protein [Methylobacterium platani]KMO13454.1 Opioid growth factor receptor (OGFr) conserved region [Methylobacterium platani JCM 14648]OAS25756.1 Opioid growth factor receptor (OGFr) conserved region [Methylobacterium platani]
MDEPIAGPIHAFLAGRGRDGRGRSLAEVLAFDDARIEGVHDFIQWLFPLREASRAVPGAPVLGAAEAEAIRADPAARAGLLSARDRMLRFYAGTGGWLTAFDHNHLRISRILTALRDLVGPEEARAFHEEILGLDRAAGSPVNPGSLEYWRKAVEG